MFLRPGITGVISVCVFLLSAASVFASETEVKIRLLATNDLHCRLRPDGSELNLGGYARLKTALDQNKKGAEHSLVLDAGDWAEGSIYYTLDGGPSCLNMLNQLEIDYSVIGNHDWLNGPDLLLDSVNQNRSKTRMLSSNLDLSEFSRAKEFQKRIPPFAIRNFNGVKVAIIGVSTYEWIYDSYFDPVKIVEPLRGTYDLTHRLKQQGMADIIVLLSHNSILANKAILKYAPDVDLILGAHDHELLRHPVEVSRGPWGRGKGYIVEAGSWGRYFTKLDLTYSKENGLSVQTELIQVDHRFQEDPSIVEKINELDSKLMEKWGAKIYETIGVTRRQFFRNGIESPLGNLLTDAYRDATGAEIGIESFRFVYGELNPGPITKADIMNINPAVYNPTTGKIWTLKTAWLSGRTIKRMLDMAYGPALISHYGFLTLSGVSFAYDPWFNYDEGSPFSLKRFFKAVGGLFSGPSVSGVQDIRVAGQPLDLERFYNVALGDGIVQGMKFINSYLGQVLPLENLIDTGKENWDVLSDYVSKLGSLDRVNILGGRIQTLHSDLGIAFEDLNWKPLEYSDKGMKAEVSAKIRNYGRTASKEGHWYSKGPTLHVYTNRNAENQALDPELVDLGVPFDMPSIPAGGYVTFVWTVTLPEVDKRFPVTVKLEGLQNEVNTTNNEMSRWFALEKEPVLTPDEERLRQDEMRVDSLY